MSARILLVEDEPGLVITLTDLLTAEGYAVESASDGITGLARASKEPFDLMVLDVMLPGKSGLDVCRELRQHGKDLAVLMLTAKTQLTDRVVGLKLGADDYLTKPFEPPELLARIEALLRRVKKEKLTPVARFEFGNVEVDFESAEVRKRRRGGQPGGEGTRAASLSDRPPGQTGVARRAAGSASGSTNPACLRAPSTCTWPGCGRSWKTSRRTPGTYQTVRGVGYRFAA